MPVVIMVSILPFHLLHSIMVVCAEILSVQTDFFIPSSNLDLAGGGSEASPDGGFGSFFFGNGGNPINEDQAHNGKSN